MAYLWKTLEYLCVTFLSFTCFSRPFKNSKYLFKCRNYYSHKGNIVFYEKVAYVNIVCFISLFKDTDNRAAYLLWT